MAAAAASLAHRQGPQLRRLTACRARESLPTAQSCRIRSEARTPAFPPVHAAVGADRWPRGNGRSCAGACRFMSRLADGLCGVIAGPMRICNHTLRTCVTQFRRNLAVTGAEGARQIFTRTDDRGLAWFTSESGVSHGTAGQCAVINTVRVIALPEWSSARMCPFTGSESDKHAGARRWLNF